VHVRLGQVVGKMLDSRVVPGVGRELDCGVGLGHRAQVGCVGDVEERDPFLSCRQSCLFDVIPEEHTLLRAHFSASVTHLVSPGASSMRYCSGDMKPCTCCAAFWAILGTLNACTASPEAHAARMDEVFIVGDSDQR
jgi:hypothetical protein